MTAFQASTSVGNVSSMVRPFGAPRILMDEFASGGGSGGDVSSGSDGPIVRQASADTGANLSISEAARALQAARRKPAAATPAAPAPAAPAAPEPAAEGAEDDQATAASELSVEGDAAPGESQVTGETDDSANPPEKAPLPLPRSWTKEQAEHWNALPRATQEYLADRDSKTSAEVRRVQNEAAEKSKALAAKETAAEQARTQYESKIKSVVEVLENEQLREFPDIRSQADLDKLSQEFIRLSSEAVPLWESDPLAAGQMQARAGQVQAKLQAWNIHQQKLVAATNELKAADERKSQAQKDSWTKHVQDENKLAAEKIPELADKVKGPALRTRAVESLAALGFTNEELNKYAAGDERISIHDHRLQQLINSHLRLAEILAAPKPLAAKPVPPVQRPGTPAPRGTAASEALKSLTSKLNNSGSLKDAVALRLAQQRAQTRRAQ
jgi:hypothetical protein